MTARNIRKGQAADANRLGVIAHAAYQHYTARMGRDPAPMHANFAAHLNADTVFVITDTASTVCGYAVMMATQDGWLLDNIAVDPGSQKAGFGGQLLAHCEAFVRAEGAESYSLYTNAAMQENIDWYLAKGFVETNRRTEHGFHRVYMQKTVTTERDHAE